MPKHVLVTGGAGYIGSHAALALLEHGHAVTVVDNLSNGSEEALARVQRLAGRPLAFHALDLRDAAALDRVFEARPVDTVMHFAGMKAVGESLEIPITYYDNNLGSTIGLLDAMRRHACWELVFSSSCTVYGMTERVPVREDFALGATNAYGRTKQFAESILQDVVRSDERWRVVSLRYFNPAGAHPSGEIGEDPRGVPTNLMPFVTQVAVGKHERVRVFGADYATPDGTCIRDFIHVVDLAEGHVAALAALGKGQRYDVINLGTGRGHSVLEVIAAVSQVVGRPIPYALAERRAGDVAESWADVAYAKTALGWQATRGLHDMCVDAWRWQSANPEGYAG